MATIMASIEIARPPEAVFAYATDFAHFSEWQGSVVSAHQESAAPLVVGSRASVTRQVGPRRVATTEEIIGLHPPQTWAVRGAGSIPVIAIAKGTIVPLNGGQRSRVTMTLEFEAHGIGKFLLPLVIRRQARRQLPRNVRQLKQALERGT